MITSIDKKTALVLIDLQKGILQFPVAKPVNEILKKAAALVSAFRKANLPVVVVNVDPTKSLLNNLRTDAYAKFTSFPSEWFEIAPELKPLKVIFSSPKMHGTLLQTPIWILN